MTQTTERVAALVKLLSKDDTICDRMIPAGWDYVNEKAEEID